MKRVMIKYFGAQGIRHKVREALKIAYMHNVMGLGA